MHHSLYHTLNPYLHSTLFIDQIYETPPCLLVLACPLQVSTTCKFAASFLAEADYDLIGLPLQPARQRPLLYKVVLVCCIMIMASPLLAD